MENIIAIKHPVHFPIPDEEIRQTIETYGKLNILDIITIEPDQFSIKNAEILDFPGLAMAQAESIKRELSRDMERGIKVAYFGLAPIPLSIKLGKDIGSRNKTMAFNLGHLSKAWWEEKPEPKVTAIGLPDQKIMAPGEVVVRISISFPVQPEETRSLIPTPLCEIDITVPQPERDVIVSPEGSAGVANLFMKTVDEIVQLLPNAKRLHLFVKAPPGICFLLGTRIHDSWPFSVHLYQFDGAECIFQHTSLTC